MGHSRPLSTFGTESAASVKVQRIKILEGSQATETPGATVLKPTTEKQIVAAKDQPVESVGAPPASIKTTDETPIEAADKAYEVKCISPEPKVKEKMLTSEELIQQSSSQESEALQIESEKHPAEAVIKPVLKSEIVQPVVRRKDEPAKAMASPDIMKPPTGETSFEFKETCELTSMVMYTKYVTVFTKPIYPFHK